MTRKSLRGVPPKNRPLRRPKNRGEEVINISLSLETLHVKMRTGLK